MTALDRAILYGIEHLQAGHDLSGCEHLNLKLVVAEFTHPPREKLASERHCRFYFVVLIGRAVGGLLPAALIWQRA